MKFKIVLSLPFAAAQTTLRKKASISSDSSRAKEREVALDLLDGINQMPPMSQFDSK
jgi:hypothetical protein